jgi:hypothetical protein
MSNNVNESVMQAYFLIAVKEGMYMSYSQAGFNEKVNVTRPKHNNPSLLPLDCEMFPHYQLYSLHMGYRVENELQVYFASSLHNRQSRTLDNSETMALK